MRKIIEGDVNLKHLHLTELFNLSKVEVTGDFDCSRNTFSNLRGSPHTVGGDFGCGGDNLTNIDDMPKVINGYCFMPKHLRDKFPQEYVHSLSKIKHSVVYIN